MRCSPCETAGSEPDMVFRVIVTTPCANVVDSWEKWMDMIARLRAISRAKEGGLKGETPGMGMVKGELCV